MPLADADLIDGDLLELMQLGTGKASLQISLLDVFDHIPTHSQVPGHILDGHMSRQPQGITFESPAVAAAPGSEVGFNLAQNPTSQTQHSRYRQDQPHHLAAYGKQPPPSPDPAAWLDFMAAPFWATPITTVLAHDKIDGAAATLGANMLVPSNPKGMVKYGGGHVRLSF